MTSTFRLLAAAFLALLALITGLTAGYGTSSSNLDREARTLPQLDIWSEGEVDTLVERIVSAGLFPDAELDTDPTASDQPGSVGLSEIEAVFVDPSLRAFVNTEGRWKLVIHGDETESRELSLGDILADDWQVVSISATSVTFERGDETRTLDAYPSREG